MPCGPDSSRSSARSASMSRSTAKSGMVHGATTSICATGERRECDFEIVALELDFVAKRPEGGRILGVVVAEDGGPGDVAAKFGPCARRDLLCQDRSEERRVGTEGGAGWWPVRGVREVEGDSAE